MPQRLDGRVEGAIRQSRPIDGAAQNFYQIRVWPFENTVAIETTKLAVWAVQAQHILNVIQRLERGGQSTFRDIPIRMIGHERNFGPERSAFTLDALERLRGHSSQPEKAAGSGCEKNETAALH